MKVIALELGWDNSQLRNPGETFELPDEVVLHGGPAWFEPVEKADKAKFEAAQKAYAETRKPGVAAVDPAKQAAQHAWFEPVEKADKAKFEAAQKAYAETRKPGVAAVDPAKQAAQHDASVKALAKAEEENAALRKEIETLKAKK